MEETHRCKGDNKDMNCVQWHDGAWIFVCTSPEMMVVATLLLHSSEKKNKRSKRKKQEDQNSLMS
jgi:hypothetical protein